MRIVRGKGTHPLNLILRLRYELLLLALSTYVLRNKIPTKTFRGSRKLLEEPKAEDVVKVHELIHLYALSKDIRRRNQVHKETQSFSKLLREKDAVLTQKEKSRPQYLDIDSVHKDCNSEVIRWERYWTAIKGDWILENIRATLSPTPPSDFFSQSYEEAFKNYAPDKPKVPGNIIQHATNTSQNNIANLRAMEISLHEEIKRLEGEVTPATPSRRTSLRKSMPPVPSTLAPPSPKNGIQFKRSMSRLGRSVSEEPPSRGMASEHGVSLRD